MNKTKKWKIRSMSNGSQLQKKVVFYFGLADNFMWNSVYDQFSKTFSLRYIMRKR